MNASEFVVFLLLKCFFIFAIVLFCVVLIAQFVDVS
jgi:hypothetical protein